MEDHQGNAKWARKVLRKEKNNLESGIGYSSVP